MDKNKRLQKQRRRRRNHVRNRLRGSSEKPRLSIHRSLKHFSCQLIDDESGTTIVSASTLDGALRENVGKGGNCEAAAKVGASIAEKAIAAGVSAVKLDRGHNRYHGRVKAFADAAREGGLKL